MYLWLKVFHLFAMVAWMAGIFYLPRLFVYHADVAKGSELDRTFRTMESRLLRVIMRPAAVVTVMTGVLLVVVSGYRLNETWLLMKLAGVVGMIVFHGALEKYAWSYQVGNCSQTGQYFRILNEIPTVLLFWILIFVVVKPLS